VARDVTKTEEEIVEETVVDGITVGVDLVSAKEGSEGVVVVLRILVKVEEGTTRERLSRENLRW
jgi:hypothetical protein